MPRPARLPTARSSERAGLLVRFFGKDGQGQLTLEGFSAFLAALREELVRLEFKYYDFDNKVCNPKILSGIFCCHKMLSGATADCKQRTGCEQGTETEQEERSWQTWLPGFPSSKVHHALWSLGRLLLMKC